MGEEKWNNPKNGWWYINIMSAWWNQHLKLPLSDFLLPPQIWILAIWRAAKSRKPGRGGFCIYCQALPAFDEWGYFVMEDWRLGWARKSKDLRSNQSSWNPQTKDFWQSWFHHQSQQFSVAVVKQVPLLMRERDALILCTTAVDFFKIVIVTTKCASVWRDSLLSFLLCSSWLSL